MYVDLHCHSTASDGSLAPAEVVRMAKSVGVGAMSLTDHDTVAGNAEAAQEARRVGIDFITGIEISCEFRSPGTMHILGYGVDVTNGVLADLSNQLLANRNERNPRMIARLNELNVAVTMKEWEDAAGGEVIGRPHLAQILVRKGYANSVKQAFDKYLGQGGLAYFDKEKLPRKRALEMIFASGGVPVLAHPYQLRCTNDAELETIVKDLADRGLVGIEVLHSDHDAAAVKKYSALADRFGLVKTGGSDFHGASKKSISFGWCNGARIPRAFFDGLKSAHQQHHGA